MIKVLHFELTANRGGIETFLTSVYQNIDREKIVFDFITTAKKVPFEEQLNQLGSTIYHIPAAKNVVAYAKKISEIINGNDYDVIHLNKNSAINIVPLLIAKKAGCKNVILHSHNTAPTMGKVVFLHYLNRKLLLSPKITKLACSKKAAQWLFNTDDPEKVTVIPNGIDLESYHRDQGVREEIRSRYGIDDKTILLGNVGRLSQQKNHKYLLDLLERLPTNYKLMIVGKGELKEELEASVTQKNLAERVIFTGSVPNVKSYLMAMDLFLMPSLFEGLPVAGVEAQASGLNVIVSDTVSRELKLTPNIHYVTLSEPTKWIEAIKRYSRSFDEDAVSEVRRSGYDIKQTSKKLEQLYLELVKGKKSE